MERILQKSNYSPDKLGKAKGKFGTGTFILKSGYLKVPENGSLLEITIYIFGNGLSKVQTFYRPA